MKKFEKSLNKKQISRTLLGSLTVFFLLFIVSVCMVAGAPIEIAPVPNSSDTIIFQNNLYHTGVTSQAGPIYDPELAWAARTGYMNSDPLVFGDLLVSACSY